MRLQIGSMAFAVRVQRSGERRVYLAFFFNDATTTELYTSLHTLSLHDALPIYLRAGGIDGRRSRRGARQRVAEREGRSEEHTSELQSRNDISYAVFCLKKKKTTQPTHQYTIIHNKKK